MSRWSRPYAIVLLLAACGAPAPDADTGLDSPATDTADPAPREGVVPAPPERAASRTDTILIEGMPEATTSQLLTGQLGAGVPFSTYIPQGIEALYDEGDAAAGVRFAAAFTGTAQPDAYMHVRAYAAGATPVPADVAAGVPMPWQDRAAGPAGDCRVVDPPAWAEAACAFDYAGPGGERRVGRAVVARRGERAFHVLTHYPAEFGDGLGPRFQRILADWRWEDTGDRLVPPATPNRD